MWIKEHSFESILFGKLNVRRKYLEAYLMKKMTDTLLIDTYCQAVTLKLHPHFIHLLKLELLHRSLFDQIQRSFTLEDVAF